jgi:hypothetical protein
LGRVDKVGIQGIIIGIVAVVAVKIKRRFYERM